MKESSSFEKEKRICHCIEKYTHTLHHTGLVSTNSARSKVEVLAKKESVLHQENEKKWSLKSRKRSIKESPERFKVPKEAETKDLQHQGSCKSKVKETRGWMEKKKALIEIQSICRVPTK